jgi:hypothetical protein
MHERKGSIDCIELCEFILFFSRCMTGVTFRDDIKKFWAGHLATQNHVREGWERLKKKKLGSQEILSQPKQKSQHVS